MPALPPLAALLAAVQAVVPPPDLGRQAIRIGVLTDLSGPWAGMSGAGSIAAAQLAIDDCLAAECRGLRVELLSADHQESPSRAVEIARGWFARDGVVAIADLTVSAVALAVQRVAAAAGRITLASGPATTRLTNEECSPTGFHWMYDADAIARGAVAALDRRGRGRRWFLVSVDDPFGRSLEEAAVRAIGRTGGRLAGRFRHPADATDFSAALLAAQASRADFIGLANGARNAVDAIEQAREFGITDGGQVIVPLLLFLDDLDALGLPAAQGSLLVTGFYWDLDPAARAWAGSFLARTGRMPTMVHAGVYSSVRHLLRAIAASGRTDGPGIARAMHRIAIDDPILRHASIRPDGLVVHDLFLARVKAPRDSHQRWDSLAIERVIPAREAFAPPERSTCPLLPGRAAKLSRRGPP